MSGIHPSIRRAPRSAGLFLGACLKSVAADVRRRIRAPYIGGMIRLLKPEAGKLRIFRQALAPLALAAACGCATTSWEPVPAPAPPESYIRVAHPDDATSALQIAARRFDPPERRGPVLWLVAVSHVGDKDYYRALQQLLDAQDLVLFEGVGGPPEPVDERAEPGLETGDNLQANLAGALGLMFQFDGIDYERPHFQNSDLTLREMHELMRQEHASVESGEGEGGGELEQLMGLMEGTSLMGMVVNLGLNAVARSPALQAVMRLVMVETLGNLKGDISQLQSLPPGLQRLVEVIIRERNKTVMADVKAALVRARPPRSMAVFYGAGHMPDLEMRLRQEFGYRPAEDVWLTAFSANVEATGMSEAQINWLRSMVQYQLDQLEFKSPDAGPQASPAAQ